MVQFDYYTLILRKTDERDYKHIMRGHNADYIKSVDSTI